MLKQKWTLQQRQTMTKLQSHGLKGKKPNKISISFWCTHCTSKVTMKGHCWSDLVSSLSPWASNTNIAASFCIWAPKFTISASALRCLMSSVDCAFIYTYIFTYIYTHTHIYSPKKSKGLDSASDSLKTCLMFSGPSNR